MRAGLVVNGRIAGLVVVLKMLPKTYIKIKEKDQRERSCDFLPHFKLQDVFVIQVKTPGKCVKPTFASGKCPLLSPPPSVEPIIIIFFNFFLQSHSFRVFLSLLLLPVTFTASYKPLF